MHAGHGIYRRDGCNGCDNLSHKFLEKRGIFGQTSKAKAGIRLAIDLLQKPMSDTSTAAKCRLCHSERVRCQKRRARSCDAKRLAARL